MKISRFVWNSPDFIWYYSCPRTSNTKSGYNEEFRNPTKVSEHLKIYFNDVTYIYESTKQVLGEHKAYAEHKYNLQFDSYEQQILNHVYLGAEHFMREQNK